MTRDKYKHPPRRVWITWDDAYPWEFERPDATEYMLVIKTGGFTCVCCGRNMELRIDGKFCNECAGYRSVVTSDSARRAAEEIADYVSDGILGMGNEVTKTDAAKFLEIVSKYFAAAPADNDAERLRWLLKRIIADLPKNRDWLDPDIEQEARELAKGDYE